MRGLEKTALDGANRQTDRHTDTRTLRLLDQLGPEGRVGEKGKQNKEPYTKSNMKQLL